MDTREWLEPDGRGGYASGAATLIPTRRYHAYLIASKTPPHGRVALLSHCEVWIEIDSTRIPLSSFNYRGATPSDSPVLWPKGVEYLSGFSFAPWPTWHFTLPDHSVVIFEVFIPEESPSLYLSWRYATSCTAEKKVANGNIKVFVRPLCAFRDMHGLQSRARYVTPQSAPCIVHQRGASAIDLVPAANVPTLSIETNGSYASDPCWYDNFLYIEEQARGYDAVEDLYSPGIFTFVVSDERPACIIAGLSPAVSSPASQKLEALFHARKAKECDVRAQITDPFDRAANAYLVKGEDADTIIAGYPWFSDWGRDTFIALRGLCIERRLFGHAEAIFRRWMNALSHGMIPNRFLEADGGAEYNSVDASLWFIIAADAYCRSTPASSFHRELHEVILEIVKKYRSGTRYAIHADRDALLACGEVGVQLTWMDAKVGEHVVTPRTGKPVEVNALWINALWIASSLDASLVSFYEQAYESFLKKFWNEGTGALYDVIDRDHVDGVHDAAIRPNQIFAVGGLPMQILQGARAARVMQVAETELVTPGGIRSLSPHDLAYKGQYCGDQRSRDEAYHQGTGWLWLWGAFIEGWLRVRGNSVHAAEEAYARFIAPHEQLFLMQYGGHLAELTDGDAPFSPRGAPFQAWSIAEFLRARALVARCRNVAGSALLRT